MKWVIRFSKVCNLHYYLWYPLFLESTYYTFCKISLMYWPSSSFSFFFLHLNSVGKTKQYMSHPSLKSAVLFFIFQSGLNVSVKLKPRQERFPFSNMKYSVYDTRSPVLPKYMIMWTNAKMIVNLLKRNKRFVFQEMLLWKVSSCNCLSIKLVWWNWTSKEQYAAAKWSFSLIVLQINY